MNIQIITSSYPAYPDDPSGTAGLFVQAFALELQKQGHQVILQPVARKQQYTPDAELTIEPLPWQGGDRELASLNMYSPVNWIIALTFFLKARKKVIAAHAQYRGCVPGIDDPEHDRCDNQQSHQGRNSHAIDLQGHGRATGQADKSEDPARPAHIAAAGQKGP